MPARSNRRRRRTTRRRGGMQSVLRQLATGIQRLEERALFSIGGLPSYGSYDAAAAYIAPMWFEDFSTADMPERVNPAMPALQGVTSAPGETPDAVEAATFDTSTVGDYDWVVQFDTTALDGIASAADTAELLAGDGVQFQVIRGLGLAGQVLLRSSGASADDVAGWLQSSPCVAAYELDVMQEIQATPNDPGYSSLWGLRNTGQVGGHAGADIDAEAAWEISTGSRDIVVGVIDTGVNYNHPDLRDNMWRNPGEIAGNGLDDDRNGFVDDVFGYDFVNNDGDPMDDHGHGSHCAGTIGATGDNGMGVAGVNWSSSIMALKFLSASGRGYISDAVRAVNYATMMRAQYGVNVRVTNNSWGGGGYSSAMAGAIQASNHAGILFVAAAGNSGSDNDRWGHYPSSYNLPNVLAVAATDPSDNLASFSCYGATSVDLAAPGVWIYSTVANSGYSWYSGTSMATPHVAGVAALGWSVAPEATVAEMRAAILEGVEPLPSLAGKVVTGGRLNAYNTLRLLPTEPQIATLSADPDRIEAGMALTLTAAGLSDPDGSVVGVDFYYDANVSGQLDAGDIVLGRDDTIVDAAAELAVETAGLPIGTHTFFARAVDDRETYSEPVATTVTVLGPDDHGDDADSSTPVVVTPPAAGFEDGRLTIIPGEHFAGEFTVRVIVDDGIATDEETFRVIVPNAAPVLEPIDDQTMPHTDDTLLVPLAASDADGDELTFSAKVLGLQGGQVDARVEDGVLVIDPAEGFAGVFGVRVFVSDGMATVGKTLAVTVLNEAPVLEPVGDRAMPHQDDTLSIVLSAWDEDGDPLTYTAELVTTDPLAELAYDVDRELRLRSTGDYYRGTWGRDEKYLQSGDGTWHYILPDGNLYRWGGDIDSGTLVARLDPSFHADPGLLHDAVQPVASDALPVAAVSLQDNVVVVDPAAGFAGEFYVRVGVSDGMATTRETFQVNVLNTPPELGPIDPLAMSHNDDTISVELVASDPDGDALIFSAELLGLSADAATLRLEDNLLVIDPADGFAGELAVLVSVDDGFETVEQVVAVHVENALPVLEPIGPQTMSHTEDAIAVAVVADDADGDPIALAVELVTTDPLAETAYHLDQELGLRSDGDYHEDTWGLGEKYVQSENGAWHYILPGGELYRCDDGVDSSVLVARLDSTFHADPSLLHDAAAPQPLVDEHAAELRLEDGLLWIDPAEGFVGEFHVRVTVDDGIESVEEVFGVEVTNAAPVLVPIGEVAMSHTEDTAIVVLAAADADGDSLQYVAEVFNLGLGNVELRLDGNVLTIDPADGYVGAFEVGVAVSDGLDTVEEIFAVHVANAAPLLQPIAPQMMPHTQDTLCVPLSAGDADGDPLEYAVELLGTGPDDVALRLEGDVLVIDPTEEFAGAFEVRVAVTDGFETVDHVFGVQVTNAAPVLEPIGNRTMPHTQDALSVGVSAFDADGDPLDLAAEVLTPDAADVALRFDGDVLMIDPPELYSGVFDVRLTAGDGIETVDEVFRVSVTNAAPVLEPIGNRTMAHTADSLSIVLSAFDADGDSLDFSAELIGTSPGDVAIRLRGDTLTIDPADGFAGEAEVRVTVGDGIVTTGETFRVSVTNAAPLLKPIGNRAMPHTQDVLELVLSAGDGDGDLLSYSAELLSPVPDGVALQLDGDRLIIDPAEGFAGRFEVRAAASDGITAAEEVFAVTVVNAKPVLEPIGNRSMVHHEDAIAVALQAFDADGDRLTFSAEAVSPDRNAAVLTLTDEGLTIDPADGYTGRFEVCVSVDDGIDLVSETFCVSVTNAAPVLEPIGDLVVPHTADAFSVELAAWDADGDALTYSAKFVSYRPGDAQLTLEGNLLTIDPADGFAGELDVLVAASDGIETTRQVFGVRVVNAAPVLEPVGHREMSHVEDAISIELVTFDEDGDTLTHTAELLGAGREYAELTLDGKRLSVNPNEGYAGPLDVRVAVSDGIETVAETFRIDVLNAAPVLEPIGDRVMSHNEDAIEVVLTAFDADNDPLTFAAEVVGQNRDDVALRLDGDRLVIDPADGFAGHVRILVTAEDGIIVVGQTFGVSVVNAAPQLAPIGWQIMSHNDDTIGVDLAAHDADGDPLRLTAEVLGPYADDVALTIDGDRLTIDPADGFAGRFDVLVGASDGIATAERIFTVEVFNAAPVFEPIGHRVMSHVEDTMTVELAAFDPDGDPLSYSATLFAPDGSVEMQLEGNLLTIDPADGYVGQFAVRVSTSDGIDTVGQVFSVSVVNAAPELESIGHRSMPHTEDLLTVELDAHDPDGDRVTFAAQLVGVPAESATLRLNGNVLTIDPHDTFAGGLWVYVTAGDGMAVDAEVFQVTVTNAAPVLEPIEHVVLSHVEDHVAVDLTAFDADGDQLRYTADLLSPGSDDAELTVDGNRLVIDPADDYTGTLLVRATVTDGIATIGRTFYVSVVNAVPVLQPIGNHALSHREDSLSVELAAEDADGDLLEFAAELVSPEADGASLVLDGNRLTIDPADGFAGRLRVSVAVTDGLATTRETFEVSVLNAAPELDFIGDHTMSHTTDTLAILLAARDADGDELAFDASLVSPSADRLALRLEDNLLIVDPLDGLPGRFEVLVTVSDGIAVTGEQFEVSVLNAAPVLQPIADRVMPHTQDLLAIDLAVSDADGDPIELAAELVGPGAEHASVEFDENRLLVDPDEFFAGGLDVQVTAADGIDVTVETFRVTVTNSVPVLDRIGNHTMPHTQDLLAIDLAGSDADGDALGYTAELVGPNAEKATLRIDGDRLLLDPVELFAGQLEVRVAVTDAVATVGETFSVTVTNAAPVLQPIGHRSMSHTEDAITIPLAASDNDGDAIQFSAEIVTPGEGFAAISVDGNLLRIDPADRFAGQFEVRVRATDGIATAAETFTVTVTNAAPVLEPIGDRTMIHNEDVMRVVLGIHDADDDPLEVGAELLGNAEEHASLQLDGGVLLIDPIEGFTGQLEVHVAVCDGIESTGETFVVSVLNTAPVVDPIEDVEVPHGDDSTTVDVPVTDPDGDSISYTVELELDVAVDGTIGLEGDEDWFRFDALAGKTYVLSTELIDLQDSVLALYDRDGLTTIANDDNAGEGLASEIVFSPEVEGTYFVSVAANEGTSGGQYRMHFALQNQAPVLERIGNQTISGSEETLGIELLASDADGDRLTLGAGVCQGDGEKAAVSLDGNRLVIDPADGFAGQFRVWVSVTDGIDAAGETFTVDVAGLGDNEGNAAAVEIRGDTMTLLGTAGRDEFHFDAALQQITANGIVHEFDAAAISSITIDAGGGADEIEIRGTSGNERFAVGPAFVEMIGGGFQFLATGTTRVTVDGGGGFDKALMFDSPGDDLFLATSYIGMLSGDGFVNQARNVDEVHGYSGGGGFDVAKLFDSPGDDRFEASPAQSTMYNEEFYRRAKGFSEVHAYATGGGTDRADLFGSAGDDTFTATPLSGALSSGEFYARAKRFDSVTAHAGEGGFDRAELYDSAGNDRFVATPDFGVLGGNGFSNRAEQFDTVLAHGGAGGRDVAKLFDSAGNDRFIASPTSAGLNGGGFDNRVQQFSEVHAYAKRGVDVAEMFDSAGDDTFDAGPNQAAFSGDAFYNRVKNFDRVDARASEGGHDTARLHDSAGRDLLVATPTVASMSGEGFENRVRSFDAVQADALSGGFDVAKLFDSPGDDTFVASPWNSGLLGDGFDNQARAFDEIHAYATGGGRDVAKLFDSPGDDVFEADADQGILYGQDFYRRARQFDEIHGYATAGGNDLARLRDSAGDDVFEARPGEGMLYGEGFYNRVKHFEQMEADGGHGGDDRAFLHDSAGDDLLQAADNWTQIAYGNQTVLSRDFQRVKTMPSSGGADTKQIQAVDFLLEMVTPWLDG